MQLRWYNVKRLLATLHKVKVKIKIVSDVKRKYKNAKVQTWPSGSDIALVK